MTFPVTAAGEDFALPIVLAVLAVTGMAAAAAGLPTPRIWTLLVLTPLLEEAVFRAGLQEALLRRWPLHGLLANAVTALAFGLAHMAVRADAAALVVALPALLIGLLYQRSGRLRWCVALHTAMNAIWLLWTSTLDAAQVFG